MNLADGLRLHARISEARTLWLEVERAADEIDDHEFYLSISSARMAILDAKDRLEQLLTDPEPEADLEVDGALA